jgi:hypothetical protein
LVVWPLAAGQAHAATTPGPPLVTSEPKKPQRPSLKFRIVQDPIEDPKRVHNSGIIAQTEIAPGATLGLGLLRASPKKLGSGDWHLDRGAPRSRKAAIQLQWRF